MAPRKTEKRSGPDPGRVLNYTTRIAPQKSIQEIQAILVAHGARSVTVSYGADRFPEGVTFHFDVGSVERVFRLKTNWRQVRQRMIEHHNRGKKAYDRGYWNDSQTPRQNTVPTTLDYQARCTAWRITKDALEAMLNLTQAGIADAGQVLFGFGLLESGQTIYEQFVSDQQMLPAAGATG